jgi:1-hydroxycarotenoid 3,4-desaturase
MSSPHVAVVGAGMGGLAAALDLARQGVAVTVFERAGGAGGKMRTVPVGDFHVDAGPTVFTMRWVFDSLFEDAGSSIDDWLGLESADVLARHAWRQGGRLDLFADVEASADAIGQFAGARDAQGFRRFVTRSAEVFGTLRTTFMEAEQPSMLGLIGRVGVAGIPALLRTAPHQTLWGALGRYFRDPRLRQLFGRYATYVGSSPMQAPATLMLIAFVEQEGVWLVRGGMRSVAASLQALAERHGASFRFGAHVSRLHTAGGRVSEVELAGGERTSVDAVVFNGDSSALAQGLLGDAVQRATAPVARSRRALSAVTWCLAARTSGFPLLHHNVFFGEDYAREFEHIFRLRTVTEQPTVYVCAQARGSGLCGDSGASPGGEREPLLVLVNAPPDGDQRDAPRPPEEQLRHRAFGLMADCGLQVADEDIASGVVTDPAGFHGLFPGTGGALYGRANHGPLASFQRPGAAARVPGLYLAGGSVHPGAGVPMTTLSGRLAAARVLKDLAVGGRRRGAVRFAMP